MRSEAAGDGLGKAHGVAGAAQVGGQRILGFQGGDDGFAQALGILRLTDVVEHLRRAKQQRARVGLALPCDIRRRAVHGFEDRRVQTDVGARRQAQAADQAGAQVGDDVAEQVGGHDDVELLGTHHQLHAGVVDDHFLEFDFRILRGHIACHLQEQARGRLDDVGLVHGGDLLAAGALGQLEGVAHDALGALAGDPGAGERGLAILGHRLAFAQIRTFGVFADRDQVNAVGKTRLGVRERLGRTHVGVQVELATHGDVDRAETLADRRGQRTFQRHLVLGDRRQSGLGQQIAMLFQRNQAGVGVFVGQASLQRVEHEQRGIHDLRADAVAADDRDCLRHNVGFPNLKGGAPAAIPGKAAQGGFTGNYARCR
ncbi:hypothetical protein XAC2852_200040 [Xanthomonas citri pv. citri]|nr:hypothetical protein XAC2852_200040 [Xanthomonas citri pv. citri]